MWGHVESCPLYSDGPCDFVVRVCLLLASRPPAARCPWCWPRAHRPHGYQAAHRTVEAPPGGSWYLPGGTQGCLPASAPPVKGHPCSPHRPLLVVPHCAKGCSAQVPPKTGHGGTARPGGTCSEPRLPDLWKGRTSSPKDVKSKHPASPPLPLMGGRGSGVLCICRD